MISQRFFLVDSMKIRHFLVDSMPDGKVCELHTNVWGNVLCTETVSQRERASTRCAHHILKQTARQYRCPGYDSKDTTAPHYTRLQGIYTCTCWPMLGVHHAIVDATHKHARLVHYYFLNYLAHMCASFSDLAATALDASLRSTHIHHSYMFTCDYPSIL